MTGLLIEVASNNGGDISQMSIDIVGDLVFEAFRKREDDDRGANQRQHAKESTGVHCTLEDVADAICTQAYKG